MMHSVIFISIRNIELKETLNKQIYKLQQFIPKPNI